MDTKQRIKNTRKKIKELGLKTKRKFVTLKCKCGRIEKIHTDKIELYTQKIKNDFRCFICKKKDV